LTIAGVPHLAGQNFVPCAPNICPSSITANVGIGTVSPVSPLHVGNSSTAILRSTILENLDTGGQDGKGASLEFYGRDTVNGQKQLARIVTVGNNSEAGNYIGANLAFYTRESSGQTVTEKMRITSLGNVGIGTSTPQYLLTVKGIIGARQVIVTSTMGADYVFKPEYHLRQMSEVSAYIKEHHHLPEVPSEAEVQANGVNLGDMQMKLLAKVEELTLHAIQADERNNRLEQQNRELQDRVALLEIPGVKGEVKAKQRDEEK